MGMPTALLALSLVSAFEIPLYSRPAPIDSVYSRVAVADIKNSKNVYLGR